MREDSASAHPVSTPPEAAPGVPSVVKPWRSPDSGPVVGGEQDLYTGVLSHLLAGPLTFGLIGYGLDRWLRTSFFIAIGVLLGMALALYVIWLRYGALKPVVTGEPGQRQDHNGRAAPGGATNEERQ